MRAVHMTYSPRGALALSLLLSLPAGAGLAQDSGVQYLGVSQVFNNDWFGMPIGDRFDRWRTGSYQVSVFLGRDDWDGALPSDPFALMEYHFRGEIIAPDNLSAPAPGDRLYAPALYFGAATHFEFRGLEVAASADLVLTGDQTGLMGFHDRIHQTFGGTDVDLSNFIIEDGIYLNATVEGGRTFDVGTSEVRPFVEAQVGMETLVRVGGDFRFGAYDADALLIRDTVTGQRVIGIPSDGGGGFSFTAGGDVAYVGDSVLLPRDGPDAESIRYRLRGGVNYAFGPADLFYGVTYLSEEFEGQDEGQLEGTLSLMLRF
jgi:hypothetical protein